MKQGISFVSIFCLAICAPSDSFATDAPFKVVAGQRQLFLDDAVIERIEKLARTMHQPTKRGAVLKPDIPSDGKLIQVRSAPMWDDQEQVYKMLYRPYPKNSPHRYSAALALSKDGIH